VVCAHTKPALGTSAGTSVDENTRGDSSELSNTYIETVKRHQERMFMCVGTAFRNRGEKEVLHALLAVHPFQEKCVIFDGGANVGGYSADIIEILESISRSCRIFAYEPVPPTFKRLNSFASSDKARGMVHAVHAGIGIKAGKLDIHFTRNADVGASFRQGKAGKSARVDVTTIDAEVERHVDTSEEILLVKLDVESFEWPALKGMAHLLANRRAVAIQWERHVKHLPKHSLKIEIDFVSKHGYRVYFLGRLPEKFAVKENTYRTFLIRVDGEHWSQNYECFHVKLRTVLNVIAVKEGHPFHDLVAPHAMICSDASQTCRLPYERICDHAPNVPTVKGLAKGCSAIAKRGMRVRLPKGYNK